MPCVIWRLSSAVIFFRRGFGRAAAGKHAADQVLELAVSAEPFERLERDDERLVIPCLLAAVGLVEALPQLVLQRGILAAQRARVGQTVGERQNQLLFIRVLQKIIF